MKPLPVGIDAMAAYVPKYYLALEDLAVSRQLPRDRYRRDLGQETMALCPPNEDIITMAVNACFLLDLKADPRPIDWILFCTESSVDQSKSAALYIQHFLGLSNSVRCLELKQACYSATGALELAHALVSAQPESRVLVVASDIARYGLGTIAEPTQGCGAIAFTVTSHPRLLTLDQGVGALSGHVMDFWRPNYLDYAVVSNQYSVKKYVDVLRQCWSRFSNKTGVRLGDLAYCCYHTPFAKMAKRIHQQFCQDTRSDHQTMINPGAMDYAVAHNKFIGNAYTGALYFSLLSLLDRCPDDLGGKKIGLFSYGSGCVAQYFSMTVVPTYQTYLQGGTLGQKLKERHPVDYPTYEYFYHAPVVMETALMSAKDYPVNQHYQTGPGVRLLKIEDHQRIYTHST